MPENLAFTRKIMVLPDTGAEVTKSRPNAINETPSQIRDVTCHTWNYTVLAATRHK